MPPAVPESIVIADYDPRWPQMFEEERARIVAAVGEWLTDIQHCGSTAVPGLAAKPVIDIYVGLRPDGVVDRCIAAMKAGGYQYRGKDLGFPGDHLFIKTTATPASGQNRRDGSARTHNIHICEISNPEWRRHIWFRDYLRQDASVARRYGDLKRALAKKYGDDINGYGEAKTAFIEVVLGRARAGSPIPVRIVDYDPAWPAKYEAEKDALLKTAGAWLVAIEHLGSTSVPGLAAKPVIDMVAAVARLDDAKHVMEPLAALGYDYVPEYEVEMPERRYFRKGRRGSDGDKYHLHVVEPDSEFWRRHLAFRDYLRAHPEAAREYADLKRRLASEHGTDVDAYTEAKTGFIRGIEQKGAAAAPGPRHGESPAETSSSAAERGISATR
jgi:GrpB-like predicted nucleotidyltransferase (UPF0157 family)